MSPWAHLLFNIPSTLDKKKNLFTDHIRINTILIYRSNFTEKSI